MFCALSTAFFSVLVPETVHAGRGHGTTVLLARDTQMSGFERRIKAELEVAGFNVKLFDMDFREDTQRILDLRAHALNAAAAIVCRQSAGFVEIWIADKVTNKTVLRRIQIPADEDAEAFVAISTVELLRASLLEIHTVAELTGTVRPTPEIEKLIAPKPGDRSSIRAISGTPPPRFSLQVNPAVLILRFEGNPLINIQLGFAMVLHKQLELKLHGQTPVIPQRFSEDIGEVAVRAGYAALGLNWILVHPRYLASGDIGMGMALVACRIEGEPFERTTADSNSYPTGSRQTYFLPAPYIVFGMDVRLTKTVRIRLETMAGWSLSPISITVNKEEVAIMGHFLISAGLGLMFLL
ncbi:MAG: hypothetical protein JXX14_12565 [Deltaproteobacteria bacterium]|nr:hypothetical protein [Deltaproteobacteria bacterium]